MPDAGGERARKPNGHGPAGADPVDDSLSELRSLLVGPERRGSDGRSRPTCSIPSVQTRDVSRVLPDAIALRATDPQLSKALAPSIEIAVTASVRRDPRPLADALFPVMGPAIRKAIRAHARVDDGVAQPDGRAQPVVRARCSGDGRRFKPASRSRKSSS
jgi:hypothetical protein